MATIADNLKLSPPTKEQEATSPLFTQLRDNCKRMRFSLVELSGGLGDLGTFIPLTLALSFTTGMDLGVILIFAGLFNIFTGILFGLPMPVQPMKAIAAVAIAEQLLPHEIAAAGMAVGATVFLLGSSGLIKTVDRYVPRAVIRGIQLGVGLKLAIRGLQYIGDGPVWGIDSIVVAALLGIAVVAMRENRKVPSALILVAGGIAIAVAVAPLSASTPLLSFPSFSFSLPGSNDWLTGIVRGGLPQLPLTLLNSVLAVCALSGDLFPGKEVSTRKMATSVGIMNLVSGWFGGMPMCHGSGGLAGQYYFGARTGGSVVMLGSGKLIIGLFFGGLAMSLLPFFPHSILGLLLFFAGIELALPARDQLARNQFYVVAITAIGILAVNTLAGFLLGMAAAMLMRFSNNPKK